MMQRCRDQWMYPPGERGGQGGGVMCRETGEEIFSGKFLWELGGQHRIEEGNGTDGFNAANL